MHAWYRSNLHSVPQFHMQLTSLLPIFFVLSAFRAEALQNPPIAKPNCLDSCNGISIPFPFGTNKSCYQSESFRVTCNESSDKTQTLFWQDSPVEIKSILLSGQMLIMQFIAYDYDYLPNGTKFYNNPNIQLATNFTFNSTANEFTVVGCDAFGTVYGRRRGRPYKTGCTATCASVDDLEKDSCSGSGCCHTSIPQDITNMFIKVGSTNNYTEVKNFSNATFGFFAEVNSFKFSPDNLTNLRNVEKMPMLVDWAIGNGTCEEAQKTSSDYACKSTHSRCYNKTETGYGYRCLCEDGYRGNPYLDNGCQDINECDSNMCVHRKTCDNKEGSFRCGCPRLYNGDGKVGGSGCKRDDRFIVKIVTGIAAGIIFLLLVAWFASVYVNRRRMKRKFLNDFGGKEFLEKLKGRNMTFTKSELEIAIKKSHRITVLGQGSSGKVYQGTLSDGTCVAIKVARYVIQKHIDPFINEAMVLSHVIHKYAVKLIGCCFETHNPLLVYEFVTNGELSGYIHDHKKAPLFDWCKRLKIASETAELLSYIHSGISCPVIIHGDIKSDNILLDNTFTAKVADFGAARIVREDQTDGPAAVIGTRGFIDPEYVETKKPTTKSDVYSFGVLLLELLTGKPPISVVEGKEVNWVESFINAMQQESSKRENLGRLVYAEIVTEGNMDQIIRVAEIAEMCLKPKGIDRPSMKKVEEMLDKLEA